MSLDLSLPDEAATLALGESLATGIAPGRVMHLSGELGAGKTTIARGLLRALGWTGRIKSPTYPLVELYTISSLNLYHFDFYRFKEESEWLSSGFRDFFNSDSACLVEWPERAGTLLPLPDLRVRLVFQGDARRALLNAHSAHGEAWLSSARSRSPSL